MGEIIVTGPISGRQYGWRLKGDTPTAEEQSQLDAFVRVGEAAYNAEYQDLFGESAPGAGGEGVLNYLGEIPKGVGRGIVGLGERAALGAATVLPERFEAPARQGILGLSRNLQTGLQPDIGFEGNRVAETIGAVSEGLGSTAPFFALAPLGLGGVAAGAALGGGAGAGEASERARAAGATQEERNLASLGGLGVGLSEVAVPVALRGLFGSLLRSGVPETTIRARLARIGTAATAEGAQEAAAEFLQNAIEQGVYNPEKDLQEGLIPAAGLGGGVGAIIQGLVELGTRGRRPLTDPGRLLPPPDEPVARETTPSLTVDPEVEATSDAPTAVSDVELAPAVEAGAEPDVPSVELDVEPAPTSIAEVEVPAVAPAPASDFASTLDELGVPRTAAVRKAVESGQVTTAEDFRSRLARFAAATTPERRTLVNEYLQGEQTPAQTRDEAGVQPQDDVDVETAQEELSREDAAEVPQIQETQDAAPAQSGPERTDDAGAGAGPEGGIAELGAGDTAADIDTTGAGAPVGDAVGAPVLGAREPDAPTGEQRAALSPETPSSMVRGLPPLGDVTPARQLIPGARVRVDPATLQATSRPFFREGDTELTPAPAPRVVPEEAQQPAALEPTSSENMMQILDDIGIGKRAPIRDAVRRGEIASPEGFVQKLSQTRPKGEVLAKRDAWLADAQERARTGAADPQVDRVVAQFEEMRQQAEAQQRIAARFEQTASPELKIADNQSRVDGLKSPVQLLARDLRAVLGLVESTTDSTKVSPAVAANRYFGRTSDPSYAMEMIAYDLSLAPQNGKKDELESRTRTTLIGKNRNTDAEPLTADEAADLALMQGQGWKTAQRAQEWIAENLSPETNLELLRLTQREYRPIDYETRSETRDRVRGKRAGAGMTVDELSDSDLVERKRKVEADRRANEEAARVASGLTPEQWNSLDPEARQDRVEVYNLSARGSFTPTVPEEFQVQPEQAPRAPRRRALTPEQERAAEIASAIEDLRMEQEIARMEADYSASMTQWPNQAHPRVVDYLRAGQFKDAMRLIATTSPNADHRRLSERLLQRLGDVRSQVVESATMDRIRATMSPETPTLGVETPSGVYVHPLSPEAIAAMRREGHNEAADIAQEYGGQILFNEDVNISPELILHEATHAVADQVLTNKSHPLTRQLDKLRTELLKSMPVTNYGLSNVREFLAEGMTNPTFRRDLSYVTAEGRPISAWRRFKNSMRNWLRSLMGRDSIKPDTALTALDRALDGVIAINPNEMGSGDVVGASFAPGGATRILDEARDRMRVPTKADMRQVGEIISDRALPSTWRQTFMRYAVPMNYLSTLASKHLPSARAVFETMEKMQADIGKGSEKVMFTTEATAKVMAKKPDAVIKTFGQLVHEASRLQVDPRKPESEYKGYSYSYPVFDSNGEVTGRKESKRYKTEQERTKALIAFNRRLTKEQRTNRMIQAKRSFDESPEQLADWRRLNGIYKSLPADVQGEVTRMFALQPNVGQELVAAVKARLEALLPGQRVLQDKVFGMIHDKILSGKLLDPYVPLRRQGQYWLSYSAVDPMSVVNDPVTGRPDYSNAQIEQFKHSFESEAERSEAMRRLQALPPESQVSNITPYRNKGSDAARPQVPLEFVANVLGAIDGSDTLGEMVDPVTGQKGDVKKQIIEMMFDTLPETSFMNSFRKREGIRGFIGDTTPISSEVVGGDVVKNLRESAMRISRQAINLKYGAEFAAIRKNLLDEDAKNQGENPQNLPLRELAKAREASSMYADMMIEATGVPFKNRSNWSRTATSATYMMTLGFNASTALITLSQVPLFVAPFLAGKHGMARTVSAIGAANRILAGSGKERTIERIGIDGQVEQVRVPVRIWDFSVENYDTTQPENAYLRALQEVGNRFGVFNRSLQQDELLGEQPNVWQKIAGYSGLFQHHAEMYSRQVSLISSYHLNLQEQMGMQDTPMGEFVQGLKDGTIQPSPEQTNAAALEAVEVSEKTNGPIYAAAGPLASHGDVTSIMYLFKRHPLSMLNLIYQTMTRANPLGSNDPADRKMAQKQFAGMIGMLGLLSGAMGLPMMQQLGWLYDFFLADEDEPDFDTVVRTNLGEAGAFGLINYLTGLNVGDRIGMGGAIYRPSFTSENLPVQYRIFEGIGGPVVGLGNKYLNRVPELFAQGEYQRGLEAVLPSAVANVARAIRFGGEGIQTMRGDPVVDDIGPFHVAAQAFGFMPVQYTQRLAMNSAGTRIDNAIKTKRSQLMSNRNRALREGDFDTVRKIDEDIREFNQRHPQFPILPKNLAASIRSFNDRSARTNYGLAVSPRNQALINSLMEQYGRSSIFE